MSEKPLILIVEDDTSIAAGLALNLRVEGFEAQLAADGELGLELARRLAPALIILDISLPRKNGLEVLDDLRREGNRTPVVMLSARETEADKVTALKVGADDYITKPFGLAELMARVNAVLRRSQVSAPTFAGAPPADNDALAVGQTVIKVPTRAVLRAGKEVKLTHLEFELLLYFARHPGIVLSRDRLLRDVWGVKHDGSARTVDNFVAQLRSKIEDDPENPRHLVTVRGSGYRLDP
jgi:DNA-binding response OmpR family regulator